MPLECHLEVETNMKPLKLLELQELCGEEEEAGEMSEIMWTIVSGSAGSLSLVVSSFEIINIC